MRFKDLRELTWEDAGLYTKYYEESETELADACPNSRIAWNVGYHYRYAIIADCFVPVSDGGIFTQPHFTLPLGQLNQEKLNTIAALYSASGTTQSGKTEHDCRRNAPAFPGRGLATVLHVY